MHIRELNECGAIFYQHDNFGKPSKIGETKEIAIYSDLPIKETEICLAETPSRWTFQSWEAQIVEKTCLDLEANQLGYKVRKF
jgi:hypothetical protein